MCRHASTQNRSSISTHLQQIHATTFSQITLQIRNHSAAQKQLMHAQSTTKLTIIPMSYIIHSLNQQLPNACRRLCSKERKIFSWQTSCCSPHCPSIFSNKLSHHCNRSMHKRYVPHPCKLTNTFQLKPLFSLCTSSAAPLKHLPDRPSQHR